MNVLTMRPKNWPLDALDIFKDIGCYKFVIAITGTDTSSNKTVFENIICIFHWTGDWKTARMERG